MCPSPNPLHLQTELHVLYYWSVTRLVLLSVNTWSPRGTGYFATHSCSCYLSTVVISTPAVPSGGPALDWWIATIILTLRYKSADRLQTTSTDGWGFGFFKLTLCETLENRTAIWNWLIIQYSSTMFYDATSNWIWPENANIMFFTISVGKT